MTPMERVVYGGQLVTTSWESLRLRCWGSRCLYSLYCLEKLSEKGSERGFDRRFGQYTNAKTARKVSFRCPVRLRCRGVRYFSDSFRRGILGNPASGIYHSRKVRGLREHRKSRGSNLPGSLISASLCVPPVTYVQDSHRAQGHLQSDASAQPQVPSQDSAQQ